MTYIYFYYQLNIYFGVFTVFSIFTYLLFLIHERRRNEKMNKMLFVNTVTKSHLTFPFGEVGRSGYGRECGSEGYKQFANINTYYVN